MKLGDDKAKPRETMSIFSDGQSEIEYYTWVNWATKRQAPEAIANTDSSCMTNVTLCTSPLYQFFSGSDNFDGLVDSQKQPVTMGPDEKAPNGEIARPIKFYGKEYFGHVEILIGEKSGLVYRIRYDAEPIAKMETPERHAMRKKQLKSRISDASDPEERKRLDLKLTHYEDPDSNLGLYQQDFENLTTSPTIAPDEFKIRLPKGVKVHDSPTFGLGRNVMRNFSITAILLPIPIMAILAIMIRKRMRET